MPPTITSTMTQIQENSKSKRLKPQDFCDFLAPITLSRKRQLPGAAASCIKCAVCGMASDGVFFSKSGILPNQAMRPQRILTPQLGTRIGPHHSLTPMDGQNAHDPSGKTLDLPVFAGQNALPRP